MLHDEFSHAFDDADDVVFMDVYSAGEVPVPGITGRTFMGVVLDNPEHPDIEYVPRRIDVARAVADRAKAGDIVLTMGAGDVTELGAQILGEIGRRGREGRS